ncbi:response regulator transcription factor [Sphingomonas sp. S1-29]|uniref:response regulator transcription factor n=1 Tax=Sphingomonas sp. S1-29 TaxID=2991074 RepID=UPI00223EF305|nr:response regulator transcription factor [Sphingomonas sp. S1-29]UZK69042.1 response regulator transcription factor [Sphingomonas sp. S1-29]
MIRIVIAEDQAMVLGALASLLALETDIEVVGRAPDGVKALDLARSLGPHLLLSDIEMPGLTGIEVATQLAQERSATRVLIVTTFGRAGYLRRAIDAGVSGYLLKDSPADRLADAIRRVAAGGRVIDPDLAATAAFAASDPLSDRERAILRLAQEGHSNKQIGRSLTLSPGTVRNYLSEAAAKLGASNRIEAGRIARDNGWL